MGDGLCRCGGCRTRCTHERRAFPAKTIPIIVAPIHIGPADLNADGVVDGRDLAELLAAWGSFNPLLDLDANGSVGGGDLAITLSSWGPGLG